MEELFLGVRKGSWTVEEDNLLRACIRNYGEGKWHLVPQRAGLNRCRKSCRLRWLNHLNPNINRERLSDDEADMILRFHKLLGNRWSLIAARLPGRTANDVKNYWHSFLKKNIGCSRKEHKKEKHDEPVRAHTVIKPRPRRFSKKILWLTRKPMFANDYGEKGCPTQPVLADDSYVREFTTKPGPLNEEEVGECNIQPPIANSSQPEKWAEWWQSLLDDKGADEGKDAFSLSEEKGKLTMMDLWDEEPTMRAEMEEVDPSIEGQSSWSDFSFHMDLWDSSSSSVWY